MRKPKKIRVAKFVDNSTSSSIVCTSEVGEWEKSNGSINQWLEINVKFSDCNRSVTWHEFGDSIESQTRKLNNAINTLSQFRDKLIEQDKQAKKYAKEKELKKKKSSSKGSKKIE